MQAMTEERLRDVVVRGLNGEKMEEDFYPCSNLFLPIGGWSVRSLDGRVAIEAGVVRFYVSRDGVKIRRPKEYLRGADYYKQILRVIESAVSEA